MPYLIDGHNLIAKLPDFDLSDPNDEAKLVLRLRGFAAARRRKCIVIFDKGLPGGQSSLSNSVVHVVFATAFQTTADRIIMERIRDTPDAGNWTVVSSDNEVLAAARQHGMRAMLSSDFAPELTARSAAPNDIGERIHVTVPPQEVDEWLDIFGETSEDTIDPPPPAQKPTKPPVQSSAKPGKNGTASHTNGHQKPSKKATNGRKPTLSQKLSTLGKADDVHIPDNDVEAWLDYFHTAQPPKPDAAPARKPPAPRPPLEPDEDDEIEIEAAPPPRKTKPPAPPKLKGKFDDEYISNAEIEEWLDIFTDFDDDEPPPKPKKKR
jgi:uncharacterized protein